MKKLISVIALLVLMAAPSFALSDAEYLKMKKNSQSFARADRKLTNTWNKLKKSLPEFVFKELQKFQSTWVKKGRDDDAKNYIKEGYSRTEAYTMATNDRANALPEIAQNLMNNSEGYEPADAGDYEDGSFEEIGRDYGEEVTAAKKPDRQENKKSENKKPAKKSDNHNENNYDEDNDGKGEIEENRFKDSEANSEGIVYEGNYTRRNSGSKGGFMTVLITNKDDMEAEVTISLKNPEVTWSAKGWIGTENNLLELFDENYSNCQINLTFSKGRVKVESSPDDSWNEVLGEGVRLDGVYDKD
ncbi:MAG: hypothetical protein SPL10_06930 [Synergistales bacterium]|nr:hypothetical protein [Synergistales bacterium]MDY6400971.1 hypothetical protein [Synergistales bacterium]MDY6404885.1 hypothetical protein [Synergistales bacterium]MDY6411100.1 hypothetical protein [Synergistales bacterium]MDY6414872.1 hypothetical protein [Synergistales bacterium]